MVIVPPASRRLVWVFPTGRSRLARSSADDEGSMTKSQPCPLGRPGVVQRRFVVMRLFPGCRESQRLHVAKDIGERA